jgi:hypothetical protein
MKGMIMSLAREFKLIFRNGITIYLVIAPALLSLVFLLVFGGMRSSSVAFAVDASVPRELASRLVTVAELEYFEDRESLIRRVGGMDSLAGLSMEDGSLRLVVEGNEPEGFAVSRRSLVAAVLDFRDITYSSETITGKNSLAYDISMTCILLLALFIGGATLGLGGVSERESGVIRAVLISPMTLFGYILTKLLPALLAGVAGVAACAWIMSGSGPSALCVMALGSFFVSESLRFSSSLLLTTRSRPWAVSKSSCLYSWLAGYRPLLFRKNCSGSTTLCRCTGSTPRSGQSARANRRRSPSS